MHTQRAAKRAFTLIEILIVVVILGILAAIVIPQFTSAADDAQQSSVQSQLQTVRSQIELWNMRNPGDLFNPGANDWDQLLNDATVGDGNRYLQSEPRNAMRGNNVGVAVGTAAIGASGGDNSGDDGLGWYWNTADRILYAIDRDGVIRDW